MATFTYPGVYIEELSSGQHTITGVATSIGAFAGWAPKGPVSEATLVQSWSDYQTLFGGLDSRSWLGYAVNQFFANGGDQCYIIRLVWDGTIPGGANSPVACATALANGVGYGSATISAAISGTYGTVTGTLTLGVGTPVLQSVSVLPHGITAATAAQLPPLPFGASLTLAASGSFSDGSTSAPPNVNWITSDPSILSVSPGGVVTAGTSAGTATVTAVSGIISGSLTIAVTAASISSIDATPVSVSAVVGQRVQMAATAKYSDGSAPDVTGIAMFTCADSSVTFTSAATAPLAPGQFLAQTADDVPVAITAWSISSNVASFTATNTLAAGVVVSLSGFGTSTFFNGMVVTVASSNGSSFTANFIHANGSGTEAGVAYPGTTISAALPSIWTLPTTPQLVPAFLAVTAAAVSLLEISPANATVPLPANLESGETEPLGFTVATTLSNGTPGPVPLVTWTSSNPAVATVTDTAVKITEWSINSDVVTFQTATNTLTAGEVVTLSGFSAGSFMNGMEVTVLAPGLSANGFEADFVHADASATELGTATPYFGAVTVTGVGTTTITASYTPSGSSSQISVSTPFTVSSGHLTGLNVSPNTLSLAGGLTQQLTVTGTFDNGTFVDMSGYATWTSSNASYATVSATGLVKAVAAGAATIEAAWMGIDATVALTVVPAIPESIAITTVPTGTTSIAPGQNLSLVATATLSDGTPSVVTGTATWSSSAPSLAAIAGPGVVAATATAGGSLTLFASSPGVWGDTLLVSITPLASNPSRFSLLVQQVGSSGQVTTLESYVNLSVQPTDSSYVVTVINNDSNYITFTNPKTNANVVPTAPPAATGTPVAFAGGLDGTVLVPASDLNFELALLSASNPSAGINLLDRVDIFNLLCVPGETDAPTISTLQAYCARKRAFFIVDSPQYTTISNLIQSGPVGSTSGSITGEYASNSAFYFPWVQAPDPLAGNRPTLFPPCGFVAGIYAATDASRGVWKAPAGINASLTGNSGLQYVLTDLENGSLNTQAVNCERQFKVYGDVVWGARTLAGNDQAGSEWKYVPIKRLALFMESSLYDGTKWVVFEPNDETLWGQIRLNVGTFLQGLFLQGAFAGTTPAQAYFVKCDVENNPPASTALGVVNILVGFAPVYPAEFVVIQIQQIVAQAS